MRNASIVGFSMVDGVVRTEEVRSPWGICIRSQVRGEIKRVAGRLRSRGGVFHAGTAREMRPMGKVLATEVA